MSLPCILLWAVTPFATSLPVWMTACTLKMCSPFGSWAGLTHWELGAELAGALLQVSRFFSAMLQLANNGNIVILRGSDPGQAFQLRLASLEKWHQQFQNYRAPSFLQPKVQMQGLPEGLSAACAGSSAC